jgi:hypothetical protein
MSHQGRDFNSPYNLSPHGFLTRSKRSRSISGRTGPKFGVDIDNT